MSSYRFSAPQNLHQDTVAGIIFFVITSIYFYQTLQLSTPFSRGQAGPAFYPMLLTGTMYLCSVILIYRGIAAGEAAKKEIDLERFVRPTVYTAVTFGYALTLISVGYLLTTVIYTFLVTVLFEYDERPLPDLIQFSSMVALGVTVLGYIFFELIFNIRLPDGVLL